MTAAVALKGQRATRRGAAGGQSPLRLIVRSALHGPDRDHSVACELDNVTVVILHNLQQPLKISIHDARQRVRAEPGHRLGQLRVPAHIDKDHRGVAGPRVEATAGAGTGVVVTLEAKAAQGKLAGEHGEGCVGRRLGGA
jgi:hypothetical protein